MSTNNPFLTIMIGDFNAKWSNWYLNDITSFEGSKIEPIASQFALFQIIKEPTNSKSCIGLIFTSQPNMIMDSGVHSLLHSNCHHQIIYTKFDLKDFYPAPYERTISHFSRTNSDHIKKALPYSTGNVRLIISMSISRFLFFNETITNVIYNFVPIMN